MRIVLSALLVVSLVGCGKKKEAGDTSAAKSSETKTVEVDTASPSKPKLNGPAVDTCALLTKDQIKTVIGEEPKDPKVWSEPAGSMLGQCSWTSEHFSVSVFARPAGEFDGTTEVIKDGKPVAGLGEKATLTLAEGSQVLVKLPGKPYFLQVSVAGGSDSPADDEKRITEMAKVVIAAAK